ncbi:MAG TPA: hypothetical protein VH682_13485 [Gemmataceae bacterium]
MKRIGIGVLHLAAIGMAAGSFVGESIAGNHYWAAVKARDFNSPEEAHRFAGDRLLEDLWDEEMKGYTLKAQRWAVWRQWWGGLSVGSCALALVLWRTLRTEAAGISLLLCASLTLLSILMWYSLG